jgi:YVTN family beta-propeller protein
MHTKALIRIFAGVFLLAAHQAQSVPMPGNANFAVVDRYHAGGDTRWDLLAFDAKSHRLFVSRATHVQVMDADTGKLVGDIPGTEGVHGIAIADDLNVGFTSNGKSNSVTVFDLNTLAVIETIKTSGLNPDAILYEPVSKHLFVFNGRSSNATVIDAAAHKVIDTISLPGKPELAVSDDAGNIFVNIEDKNEIVVFDSRSDKILNNFPLDSGEEPSGLAIDKEHHRLFSVCANKKMEILDSVSGKIVSEVAIGAAPDSAAFDPVLGIAYSPNGDGTLTLVKENDPDHFSVLQNVATQKGAKTMAYDADKHRAFLATAGFGETPPASREQPKPRPAILPDSFVVLVVAQP